VSNVGQHGNLRYHILFFNIHPLFIRRWEIRTYSILGVWGLILFIVLYSKYTKIYFGNCIYFRPQVRGGRHLLLWVPYKELTSRDTIQEVSSPTWGGKEIQGAKKRERERIIQQVATVPTGRFIREFIAWHNKYIFRMHICITILTIILYTLSRWLECPQI
jgi:hypothetical protein